MCTFVHIFIGLISCLNTNKMKEQYQVLTQAFVAHKIMSDADLTTLVNQLNQACPGLSNEGISSRFCIQLVYFVLNHGLFAESSVENMVTKVNEQLRTLSLEIRKAVAESDAVVSYKFTLTLYSSFDIDSDLLGIGEPAS